MAKKHTRKSHRHFVVAPVLGMMILATVAQGHFQASLLSATTDDAVAQHVIDGDVQEYSSGMHAIVYSGEGFDEEGGQFRTGSALVASAGIIDITVNTVGVSALPGAFHVSYHGADISIAALTTPVIVHTGLHRVLIPKGWQWSGAVSGLQRLGLDASLWADDRQLQRMPQRFVKRQLQNVSHLSLGDNLPDMQRSLPAAQWTLLSGLRMDGALQRSMDTWTTDLLGALRYRIDAGDTEAVSALLLDPDNSEAVYSFEAFDMFTRLLGDASLDREIQMALLQHCVADEVLWSLFSVDERWREAVWTLFGPDATKEAIAARLYTIPFALLEQEPVSRLLIDRWAQELQSFTEGLGEERGSSFLHEVVSLGVDTVHAASSLGYPERAGRIAEVLMQRADIIMDDDLSNAVANLANLEKVDVAAMLLEPLDDIVDVAPEPEEEVVDDPVPEPEPEVPALDPTYVESQAYALLRDLGAVFAVNTEIKAVEPNTARVRKIIFSTLAGDYIFDFHFDVAKNEISRIIQDGKEYPYSLSVEMFGKWVFGV